MSTPRKIAVWFVVISIVLVVGDSVNRTIAMANIAASTSCVYSLDQTIRKNHLLEASSEEWQYLTEEQHADLMQKISIHGYSIDAGRNGWNKDGYLLDSWGNVIVISMRLVKNEEGILTEYRVRSTGPDGTVHTGDDILSPK